MSKLIDPSLRSALGAGSAATLVAFVAAQTPAELGSTGLPERDSFALAPHADTAQRVLRALPFVFIENRGQWDTPGRFVANKGPVSVLVEQHAVSVAVAGEADAPPVTRFVFENAREEATVEGAGALPGHINHYRGNADALVSIEGVQQYAQVRYVGLYPGIDVVLRDGSGRLEYDVLLEPGATLSDLVVRCEGVARIEAAEGGRLLLHTSGGAVLEQSAPTTWAELPDGAREPLECRYVVLDEQRYGYSLPGGAREHAVVIDPGLEWSTFLGGGDYEELRAIVPAAMGQLLVAGATDSIGWPQFGVGVPFSQHSGGADAFVALIDPSASGNAQLVWWTLLGGSVNDIARAMETNSAGQVFVLGNTTSPDFPTTAGAFQSGLAGVFDSFVAVLAPATGTLVHSTLLGGTGDDRGRCLLLEEPARVTIAGATDSPNLPISSITHDATLGGARDNFVTILDLAQSGNASLVYSSYLGGSGQDGWLTEKQLDIEWLPNGLLAVISSSFSTDHPVSLDGYKRFNSGLQDAVLVLLDTTVSGPSAIVYGTYLGVGNHEGGTCVAHMPSGALLLTGFTYSSNFPATPGAAFTTFVGPPGWNDGWLVVLDPTKQPTEQLLYSTLLPGDGYEGMFEVEVASSGMVLGVGFSGADNLFSNSLQATCGALDEVFDGPNDGLLLALTPAGRGRDDLHYLSFLGGSGYDLPFALDAVATAGTPTLVVAGYTNALDFTTTAGVVQGSLGGDFDGFLARVRLNPLGTCVASPNSASAMGARLCGSGSTRLADNNFDMTVTGLPQSSLGYFLMSTNPVPPFALPAPSQGALCLGPTQVRFRAFVLSSGATGMVNFRPDLANIPPPGAPLAPGDTAHFQYWYRDFGNVSNTSSGLAVTLD
jgi:hypothetical protein